MDVEILEFKRHPVGNKIGSLLVKYHDLFIKCHLMFYSKTKAVWVRMPELWASPEKKVRFCFWNDKGISDEFQKIVLNKLFDKYDLDHAKIEAIFEKSRAHKPESIE